MNVIIKNLSIDIREVEGLAKKYAKIDYDEITGEILLGGNDYVFVRYDWQALQKEGEKFIPIAQKILALNIPKNTGTKISEHNGYQLGFMNADIPYIFIHKIGVPQYVNSKWVNFPAYNVEKMAENLALCHYLYGFDYSQWEG